jgi:hypothetical protein
MTAPNLDTVRYAVVLILIMILEEVTFFDKKNIHQKHVLVLYCTTFFVLEGIGAKPNRLFCILHILHIAYSAYFVSCIQPILHTSYSAYCAFFIQMTVLIWIQYAVDLIPIMFL